MTGVEHQLTCELPDIPWPYFWEFEVDRSSLYLNIKRRHWYWPFRVLQIARVNYGYADHHGHLDQPILNKLGDKGAEMAQQVNPRKEVLSQARKIKFSTKVRVIKS